METIYDVYDQAGGKTTPVAGMKRATQYGTKGTHCNAIVGHPEEAKQCYENLAKKPTNNGSVCKGPRQCIPGESDQAKCNTLKDQHGNKCKWEPLGGPTALTNEYSSGMHGRKQYQLFHSPTGCLLYTSPSPRD